MTMTSTYDRHAELPMDWDQWRQLWAAWKADHADQLQRSSFRFPAKNIMADEVLGVWRIAGRTVELSEVTFLGARGIGITFGEGSGTWVPENGVVHTFAELEQELGLS